MYIHIYIYIYITEPASVEHAVYGEISVDLEDRPGVLRGGV